jgi:small subunit ribosomal protein S13
MGATKPKEEQKKPEKKWGEKEQKKPSTGPRRILPEGVRGIVRLAETDLDGTKKLKSALPKIKGVGIPLAAAISRKLGIDPNTVTGTLTDEQMARIEEAVKNPSKAGLPDNMLNRRGDPEEGKNRHIVSSTLTITRKFDIDNMKKIRCYKGVRHELGLPVRGQRTRSSFRTGMTAGVSRAKVQAAAAKGAPAAAPTAAKAAGTTPVVPAMKAGAPAPVAAGKGPAPAAAKPTAKPAEKK